MQILGFAPWHEVRSGSKPAVLAQPLPVCPSQRTFRSAQVPRYGPITDIIPSMAVTPKSSANPLFTDPRTTACVRQLHGAVNALTKAASQISDQVRDRLSISIRASAGLPWCANATAWLKSGRERERFASIKMLEPYPVEICLDAAATAAPNLCPCNHTGIAGEILRGVQGCACRT